MGNNAKWPRSQVAKAAVCKTVIRECKSRRGLIQAEVPELEDGLGLKPSGDLSP